MSATDNTFYDGGPSVPLTETDAEELVVRSCFKIGPSARIGIELEYLVTGRDEPFLGTHPTVASHQRLMADLAASRLDGQISVEPGGQIELSSRPHNGLISLIEAVHGDLDVLHRRATDAGLALIGLGVDPLRGPRRATHAPRYEAMDSYFKNWRPAGPTMMYSTAALQVNVEGGPTEADMHERWDLLYAVGPTLAAAFANSSWQLGQPTPWKSTRLATWLAIDPSRTGVPFRSPQETHAEGFARWALDARLMLIRRSEGAWFVPDRMSFRTWLRDGCAEVPGHERPTVADLDYHLTTLFPHVRPKGYFEIRYIDAQPGCWWVVPAAVIAALVGDRRAGHTAREICESAGTGWIDAARHGLENPRTSAAADHLLQLAADTLRGETTTAGLAAVVESYLERWTARSKCPADDPPTTWKAQSERCALDDFATEQPQCVDN